MLTHLHPSTCRFTLKGVPLFTVPPPLRNGGTVGWSALLGDFVVAAPKELNEAESVTKRVGHVSNATPVVGFNLVFKLGACLNSALYSEFNVLRNLGERESSGARSCATVRSCLQLVCPAL